VGTGGLSPILAQLPRERTQYVFDVSNHFFLKAQEQFRDYPFIEYKLLDIEKDPADQGFAPGAFDIVLAANVLHATRDLRQTVRNVKKLLAPGGLLLLLEGAATAGDGPRFRSDGEFSGSRTKLRPSHALLPFSGWKGLLESEGFGDVSCGSDNGTSRPRTTSSWRAADSPDADTSIGAPGVGQARAADAGQWLLLADDGGGERLAETLRARGATSSWHSRRAEPPPRRSAVRSRGRPDIRVSSKIVDGSLAGVVHMWNLMALASFDGGSLDWVMRLAIWCGIRRAPWPRSTGTPRLWIVTCGAEAVGGPSSANVTAARFGA
jgi:SAM-dependent methyltransferase